VREWVQPSTQQAKKKEKNHRTRKKPKERNRRQGEKREREREKKTKAKEHQPPNQLTQNPHRPPTHAGGVIDDEQFWVFYKTFLSNFNTFWTCTAAFCIKACARAPATHNHNATVTHRERQR
jgi:hypothetical protein